MRALLHIIVPMCFVHALMCVCGAPQIIVPVHLSVHWVLAVINMRERKFVYMDAMHQDGTKILKLLVRGGPGSVS